VVYLVSPRHKITQLELSECVVIENEIRLLDAALKEKRESLRRRLMHGEGIEEGPLEGFAAQISGVKNEGKK
jgi:hypothetical protein